ncbi:MAG: hypothetical protein M0R06_01970 [Sphaerochaeta sp.]|jgi:hypothetical protein|nr:hypothetical protein [Sphaerochaeta sp.]
MTTINTGLIHEAPTKERLLGSALDDMLELIQYPDWTDWLPSFERQNKLGLETYNCVQFSLLNTCETLANFYGKPLNLSDRFLGAVSGCVWGSGNTFARAFEGMNAYFSCLEDYWPWTVELKPEEYYQKPSDEAYRQAMVEKEGWELRNRIIVPMATGSLKTALYKSPLWVCNEGHAFMLYRIDSDNNYYFFDTYPGYAGNGRTKHAETSDFVKGLQVAYAVNFKPINSLPPKTMQYPENSLIVVVDTGERLMNVDNTCLFKDEPAKILTELVARNSHDGMFIGMPVVHVFAKDIDGITKLNLKRENV